MYKIKQHWEAHSLTPLIKQCLLHDPMRGSRLLKIHRTTLTRYSLTLKPIWNPYWSLQTSRCMSYAKRHKQYTIMVAHHNWKFKNVKQQCPVIELYHSCSYPWLLTSLSFRTVSSTTSDLSHIPDRMIHQSLCEYALWFIHDPPTQT